jgi:hypothetical protein
MVVDLVAERFNVVVGNRARNKSNVPESKRSSQFREAAIPKLNRLLNRIDSRICWRGNDSDAWNPRPSDRAERACPHECASDHEGYERPEGQVRVSAVHHRSVAQAANGTTPWVRLIPARLPWAQSSSPRPFSILGACFSTRAARVADCFAPAKCSK